MKANKNDFPCKFFFLPSQSGSGSKWRILDLDSHINVCGSTLLLAMFGFLYFTYQFLWIPVISHTRHSYGFSSF